MVRPSGSAVSGGRGSLTELAVQLIDSDHPHHAPGLQHLLSLSDLEGFQGQFEREGNTCLPKNRLSLSLTEFSYRLCEGFC